MVDTVGYVNDLPLGGFNYDNCIRNKALLANAKQVGGSGQLRHAKTGTTICGVIFAVSIPTLWPRDGSHCWSISLCEP